MKLTAIKTYLLTIAQIPVALALLIVACAELLLTKCMACLGGALPSLRTNDVMCKAADNRYCHKDREQDIQQILSLWDKESYCVTAKDRQKFEALECGRRAIRNNPDRHLYAVLRPTKQENLGRIGNVLREMDSELFSRVLQKAEKMR